MLVELKLEQVGGPALATPSFAIGKRVLFGRGSDSDVLLADPEVSRRHALMEWRGERWLLLDLGSRAGTYLNDLRLDADKAAPVHEHDRVRIGPWRFRVRTVGTAGSPRAATVRALGSATQLAMPILAAERRLELLVEFVAAAGAARTPERLNLVIVDFAQRGSNAKTASLWANDPNLQGLAWLPADAQIAPLPDAFEASDHGGVVPVELRESPQRWALVAALRVDSEALNYLQLEFAPGEVLKPETSELIHALARMAGLSLANFERRDAEQRIARLHNDLDQAHEVQQRMLPASQGALAGLRYALHVHPGRLVAGDLVDIFALSEHCTAILLGDVSGAGFGAAVMMSSAQAYLHSELLETRDPALAAKRCNDYLTRVGGGRFVTAWIGVFDRSDQSLRVVDAGHGHARCVAVDRSVRTLQLSGGIPLGIDLHAQFKVETLQLGAGERLVLYSDGVAEHRGTGSQAFVEHIDSLLRHSPSCERDVSDLLAALELHGGGRLPDDDATLLAVQRVD